jgi:hypothetical protein
MAPLPAGRTSHMCEPDGNVERPILASLVSVDEGYEGYHNLSIEIQFFHLQLPEETGQWLPCQGEAGQYRYRALPVRARPAEKHQAGFQRTFRRHQSRGRPQNRSGRRYQELGGSDSVKFQGFPWRH